VLLSRCVAFDPTAAHLADPACRRLDDLALLPGGQLAAHLHVYMHEFAAAALAGTHAARVCAAAAAAVADVAAAAENGIPPPPNTQPQAPLLLLPPPLLFTAIEHAVLTASVMSVRLNTYVDSGARLADTAHSCCRYGVTILALRQSQVALGQSPLYSTAVQFQVISPFLHIPLQGTTPPLLSLSQHTH
jgi:hypothetical protein